MAEGNSQDDTTREIALQFIAAAGNRDIDRMRHIYAEDAKIWHNTDKLELPVDQHLETFRRKTAPIAN